MTVQDQDLTTTFDKKPAWPRNARGRVHGPVERHVLSFASVALVAAGPVSLFFYPQPIVLGAAYALLGVVAGLLCLPRAMLPGLIAVALLVVGVEGVTDAALQRNEGLEIPWWQPMLLTVAFWVSIDFVPFLFRRATMLIPRR